MANKVGRDLNRSEFARLFGIAPGTVDAWIRNGLPNTKTGKSVTINAKEALMWLQDRARAEAGKATDATPDTEIRRRRDVAEMERAERQNGIEAAEIARIDEMSELWADQVAQIAAKLDAIPSRFGSVVAYACAAVTENPSPELIEEMRIAAEAKLQEAADEFRDDLSNATFGDDSSSEDEPLPHAA